MRRYTSQSASDLLRGLTPSLRLCKRSATTWSGATVLTISSRAPVLSAILFLIGAIGVLVRRNVLVILMCVELMLNAANLALLAFGSAHQSLDGQVTVLMVMAVAAAEVAVGLALIVTLFRHQGTTDVDEVSLLKG
ncbi:MAG: NADH-quinone oxidoreductase subunit NuoK [Anaerolineae bacterium]|nr:NADH-quinone oxidoreductase subunit NuoK [Anaerolineae bacterium]